MVGFMFASARISPSVGRAKNTVCVSRAGNRLRITNKILVEIKIDFQIINLTYKLR